MKRFLCLLLVLGCSVSFGQSAHPATVSWTAPTANTDGTAISATLTYNLYQGLQGASLAKVQTGISTTTATVSTGLTPGTTQCFAVTAVANGVESAQSTSACLAIVFPTPGAPSQITVVIR